MERDYSKVGLYSHNIDAYKKVDETYQNGEKTAGIIHATGTGKTYVALQLCLDNKDKKITYVVPSLAIKEHILQIIDDNPNLYLKEDFPNLNITTYSEYVNKSHKELKELDIDLLILDEFQHLGAPVWGARINTIVDTHPEMRVFGMTAYSVRDRKTSYERDMANPETDEIFSNKIVSRYDLCDAILDGVLPKPRYRSLHTKFNDTVEALEKKLEGLKPNSNDYIECKKILDSVKAQIASAPGAKELIKKSVKPNGKYIYFCPPQSVDGKNDIETIKKEAYEWFKEIAPEEDIVFYTSTSEMGEDGKKNREAFYNDVDLDNRDASGKLRVMFAINQYNEGSHAPNVDGVILGRSTSSDMVYFEQIGRALSVRGDNSKRHQELAALSDAELLKLAKQHDIDSKDREEIIEMLLSPVIIDLVDNYDYIKELENDLKDRAKERRVAKGGHHQRKELEDYNFDIEMENQDLYEMLRYVFARLYKTWDDVYELAQEYYNHHGNLDIKSRFKTIDGYTYDSNGYNLGAWLTHQRRMHAQGKLSSDKVEKLQVIQADLSLTKYTTWEKYYELASAYFHHYGNLNIKIPFYTKDGIVRVSKNEEGALDLGKWVARNREWTRKGKISPEKLAKMQAIGMNSDKLIDSDFDFKFSLAKAYFEEHGEIFPAQYTVTTEDGRKVNLGEWFHNQKRYYKRGTMPEERAALLRSIGITLENKDIEETWKTNCGYLKAYFTEHGDLKIPVDYTVNGVNLYTWYNGQLTSWRAGELSDDRIKLLEEAGARIEPFNELKWQERLSILQDYYYQNGNLMIADSYIAEDGYKLGAFIAFLRTGYRRGILPQERIDALESIGMIWNVKEYRDSLANLCEKYGIDYDKYCKLGKVLYGIPINVLESKIEFLNSRNEPLYVNDDINPCLAMKPFEFIKTYGISLDELVSTYHPNMDPGTTRT